MDDCDGRYCTDEACRKNSTYYKTTTETHCLTCQHIGRYHAELQSNFDRFMYWIIGRGTTGCTVGTWCNCTKYLPNDNLLYLEELSK